MILGVFLACFALLCPAHTASCMCIVHVSRENTHDLLNRGGESINNCRFKLKALVGHSKAGQKVTYGAIKGAKFKQLALVHALALPCCAPWHTCCNTRVVLTYIHTRCAQEAHVAHALSCSCAMYNVVRVDLHCTLISCRFDPMPSEELCIVLTTL